MTIILSVLYVLALKLVSDVEIASMAYCPYENQVSECIQNEDGKTSQCMFMKEMEITCNNDVLKPSQYKNYVPTSSDDMSTQTE